MKKLLCVYNICEIKGQSNIAYYIDSLRSILSQTIHDSFKDDFKIAISGCKVTDNTKRNLQACFGDMLSYNWVEENLPLSITFNDTINQCLNRFGEFEGYLYLDSGITFWDSEPARRCPHCEKGFPGYTALQMLWNIFKATNDSLCASWVSNDDGSTWWGLQYQLCSEHKLPLPKATNMHCQIFPEEWRKAYGKILPDIFASNTMESVFPFMCAAIHKDYIVTTKVHALHLHSLDGASIGSREQDVDRIPCSSQFQTPGLLFKTKKDMDIRYKEGKEFGFGYESCSPYWPYNASKFDEKGFAKDEKLLPFLNREMFLSNEEFDYSKIKRIWVPGR